MYMGGLLNFGDDSYSSDYFPVPAGGNVVSNAPIGHGNNPVGISFFDWNKSYISQVTGSGAPIPANTPIAVPATAVFARMCTQTSSIAAAAVMVVPGTAVPSTYIPWMNNPAIVAAANAAAAAQATANAAPSGADVATMFALRGSRNLFNLAAATPGLVYTVDGTIINGNVQAGGASAFTGYTSWPSTWMASDFFPVQPEATSSPTRARTLARRHTGLPGSTSTKSFSAAQKALPRARRLQCQPIRCIAA